MGDSITGKVFEEPMLELIRIGSSDIIRTSEGEETYTDDKDIFG